MRAVIVTLAVCATGGFAFADPPAAPAVPNSAATTTQKSESDNGSQGGNPVQSLPATAAPPGKDSVVVPAKSDASTSEEQVTERQLRSEGYKLVMVRGEEKYCRRETPVGSHLASVLHCLTVAEAAAAAKEAREVTQHIQRNTSGCLSKGAGACGN